MIVFISLSERETSPKNNLARVNCKSHTFISVVLSEMDWGVFVTCVVQASFFFPKAQVFDLPTPNSGVRPGSMGDFKEGGWLGVVSVQTNPRISQYCYLLLFIIIIGFIITIYPELRRRWWEIKLKVCIKSWGKFIALALGFYSLA